VDREGLEELFAPFAVVSVRRMFGGHGVYADGLCFALEIGGEVYLKADAETEGAFADAGSDPFVYAARGREVSLGYRRLLASAYDDEDELKRWAALGLGAAQRAAAAKRAKAAKREPKVRAKAKPAGRPGAAGRAAVGRAAPRPRH
jgi:DNA transformation protein